MQRVAVALFLVLAATLPGGIDGDPASASHSLALPAMNPMRSPDVRGIFESVDDLYAVLGTSPIVLAQSAAPQSFNDLLKKTIHVDDGNYVGITPYEKNSKKKGDVSKPGTYELSGSNDAIFSAILKNLSLDPASTDPASLKDKEGFIEYIPDSNVLNKGGKRATFGYYIRSVFNLEQTYFMLFSYDRNGSARESAAFEVFLFGPFRQDKTTGFVPDPNPPPLALGVAVDSTGVVLSQLPLTFARVSNFLGAEKGDEPVTGGVNKPDHGCLECHGRDDQFPQSTLPFPWVAIAPTPSPTPSPVPSPASGTTGSTGMRPASTGESAPIGGHLYAAVPRAENGPGKESGDYLPPIAGPNSELTGTVVNDSGSGPTDFYVGAVDNSGKHHYWKGVTDPNGHFHLRIPELAGIVALLLFKHFDDRGRPDDGASTRITNLSAHLEDTQALSNVPSRGPAILEASTSYERGGMSDGLVPLHIRDVDPLTARVMLDGSDLSIDTLASSNESVLGRLHDATILGRHTLAVRTGDRLSNGENIDVVAEHFDPIPPLHTGQVTTVHLHIDGLGDDPANVAFTVEGAASISDGTSTRSVPVHDGEADVDIRGEHAGELIVRTLLDVAVPQELAKLLPHAPEETPTPPLGGEATCNPAITDGWFEPTQGVWQDDPKFDDHPTKQITRISMPGAPPAYDAELDMIPYRDTLLFGVEHYEYGGERVRAGVHAVIEMSGTTDCSDPPVPVKMQFRFLEGDYGHRIIWTSDVVGRISLTGHHVAPVRWRAVLANQSYGVPPASTGAFMIPKQGEYKIQDELLRLDGTATGLAMTVQGNAHVDYDLKIAYVPVLLTPMDAAGRAHLDEQTESLGISAGHYIPDMYPLMRNGIEGWVYDLVDLSGTNLMNPTRSKSAGGNAFPLSMNRADRLNVELQRRFDLLARESNFQRMVLVLPPNDMKIVSPGAAGEAVSRKFVYVMQGQNYLTVAHEIAHTLPAVRAYEPFTYLWSSLQMNAECDRPGDYHNLTVKVANGFRIDLYGRPGPRRERDGTISFMSYTSEPDDTWIDQCTYWNLSRALKNRADPAVLLVRGVAAERGAQVDATLWPMYDEIGVIDLAARAPFASEHWSFDYLNARGERLALYPFEPQWSDEYGARRSMVAFAYQIPIMRDATMLELRGPNGLMRRTAISQHAPTLRITSPISGGTTTNETVRVSWSARGEHSLLTTVLYSPDGNAWYPEVFEEPVSSADVKLSSRSRTHRIKVIVTDGSRSSESTVSFRSTP